MQIRITQADIDSGHRKCIYRSPIANVLSKTLKRRVVDGISVNTGHYESRHYYPDASTVAWMESYNRGNSVPEITLRFLDMDSIGSKFPQGKIEIISVSENVSPNRAIVCECKCESPIQPIGSRWQESRAEQDKIRCKLLGIEHDYGAFLVDGRNHHREFSD